MKWFIAKKVLSTKVEMGTFFKTTIKDPKLNVNSHIPENEIESERRNSQGSESEKTPNDNSPLTLISLSFEHFFVISDNQTSDNGPRS